MTNKHAKGDEQGVGRSSYNNQQGKEGVLAEYDATTLVGLPVTIYGGVIRRMVDGEETIEVAQLDQLLAAVAVARCLVPIKLRGKEIKAIRRIAKMTMAELAQALGGDRTAPETIARWESESQPMGGYAEKILRLVICERLAEAAPGVGYAAGAIARLEVYDPWITDADYVMPPLEFRRARMKEASGSISDVWDAAA